MAHVDRTYPPIMWLSNIPPFQALVLRHRPDRIALDHAEAFVEEPDASGAVAIHRWQV